jgi:hypothetical protein
MHTALESTRVRLIAVVVVAVSLMSCSLGLGGPEATLGPTPLQPTPLFRRVVVAAVAPLRTGPGPDFESVGQLVRGDVVAVLGTSPNSQWYRVIAPDIAAEPAKAWLLTELTAEIGAAPGGAGRQTPTPSQASEVVTPSQGGGHNELTPAPTATNPSLPAGTQSTKPPSQTAAAISTSVPAATETRIGPAATASLVPRITGAPPTATHTATPLPVPSSTDTVTAAPAPSDTPTATLLPPDTPTITTTASPQPPSVTPLPPDTATSTSPASTHIAPPAGTPDPLPSLVPLPTFVFPFPTFVWP